jgi:hypothetical protein
MSFSFEQYFRECDLREKQWRAKVQINPKTAAVNRKLASWHSANPDRPYVSLAEWRLHNAAKRRRNYRAA